MEQIQSKTGVKRLRALIKKYEADIAEAETNLLVYFEGSVGIGEHSDLQTELDVWLDKLASAKDKLDVLTTHFEASPIARL